MDAHTIHKENSPGWHELVEGVSAQLEAARERVMVLLRIIEHDRQALASLTWTGRLHPALEGAPRAPSASLLHAQIMALLAQHPAGCTRVHIEAALGIPKLGDVLRGLSRRSRLARVGPGCYTRPTGQHETGRPA
jgi:hypothetical protein